MKVWIIYGEHFNDFEDRTKTIERIVDSEEKAKEFLEFMNPKVWNKFASEYSYEEHEVL